MRKYKLIKDTKLDYFHCQGNDEELIIAYNEDLLLHSELHRKREQFHYDGDIDNKVLLSAILILTDFPSEKHHYVVPENHFIDFFERVD